MFTTIDLEKYGTIPYLQKDKDKDKLEKVNRGAARFVANDYDPQSSVTAILLKWTGHPWKTGVNKTNI